MSGERGHDRVGPGIEGEVIDVFVTEDGQVDAVLHDEEDVRAHEREVAEEDQLVSEFLEAILNEEDDEPDAAPVRRPAADEAAEADGCSGSCCGGGCGFVIGAPSEPSATAKRPAEEVEASPAAGSCCDGDERICGCAAGCGGRADGPHPDDGFGGALMAGVSDTAFGLAMAGLVGAVLAALAIFSFGGASCDGSATGQWAREDGHETVACLGWAKVSLPRGYAAVDLKDDLLQAGGRSTRTTAATLRRADGAEVRVIIDFSPGGGKKGEVE